ncbi:MAG TPA: ADP-forming succinate--CoA ligase subunit beta [Albitalea sp.]
MHIHEFQGKELLRKYGVATPPGFACASPDEAAAAAGRIGGEAWVVKAQVHASNRTKSGGVRFARSIDEVRRHAAGMIGKRIATPHDPRGQVVRRLLVEGIEDVLSEAYVAIAIDPDTQRIALLGCAEGGLAIEDLAARAPATIHKAFVDVAAGLTAAQAEEAARRIGIPDEAIAAAREALLGLYRAFDASDASLAEIDPLAVTRDHRVVALDATFDIDENALFRHPEIVAMHAQDEAETPAEAHATIHHADVPLDGTIGCLVNGPGLALATIDMLKLKGGSPGRVDDVGDDATAVQVVDAFAAMTRAPGLSAILVNVMGEGLRCDEVAEGLVAAARQSRTPPPLVVRLKGLDEARGRKILARSGLHVSVVHDLADAAAHAVRAAGGW